ncbi:MAG: hypothetical protein WCG55_02385 [bacterium]
MYKKILIVSALFLSAFLFNTPTTRADTVGGGRAFIGQTETARTDGVLSRTMHVKLDGPALIDYYSLAPLSRQVELAYVLITDPSINQAYLETHATGVINGVFLYRKKCVKDSSSDTDPNFTCTIPQFTDYGTFGDEIFLQSALTRDSWPLTNIEYFNIMDVPLGKSGPDVTNLVTTPTADGVTITGDLNQEALDQIKNNGQWNDVKVWYSGVKSQTSSAGTYAQAISWQTKIPDQAALDASNNPHSFKITLTGLLPGGQYVFALKFNDLFFTSFKDFTVPSVSTSGTSTTAGFGPNAYGCSTDGQNNTYCMLAPLPIVDAQGKIDPTGKLNVSTGVGDYLKGMIKLIMGLIMVFAVFMVVVGGIEYMSSVQVGEKEGAKTRIIGALGGVVLALSSYLILNTINPNLVNITVSAPQAEIDLGEEGLESDDSGLSVPGDSPSNMTVTLPTGSAQDLAKQILQNRNITLSPAWGSQDAKSSVIQNITDTANGVAAWTSPSRQGGQIQASLDSRMLAGLLVVANNVGSVNVTELLGGQHTKGSAHYRGLAFDIGGASFSYSTTTAKKIMDICRAAGANPRQIFGPCNGLGKGQNSFIACPVTGYRTNSQHENHVHCGW